MINLYNGCSPIFAISESFPTSALMEILKVKEVDPRVGGWDGASTIGTNVRSFSRDKIGIIEINGLLWNNDDVTAYFSGLTTYESIALEVGRMSEDPDIEGLVFEIDSPGGLVSGVSELTGVLDNSRLGLPRGIAVHSSGEILSAAYWIGSAGDVVVISPTTSVGSIGARMEVYSGDEPGFTRFISNISPLKGIDPRTEEGRDEYQSSVDYIGNIFAQDVADNRGVSLDTVVRDFGQGGELFGEYAVNVGMADEIGSLEHLIDEMAGLSSSQGENIMSVTRRKRVVSRGRIPVPAQPAAAVPAQPAAAVPAQPTAAAAVPAQPTAAAAVPAQPTAAAPAQPTAAAPAQPTAAAPAQPTAAVPAQPTAAVPAQPAAAAVDAERNRVAAIVQAISGTPLEGNLNGYIQAGTSIEQVNSDLVASFKQGGTASTVPLPSQPTITVPVQNAAAQSTLTAMRNESNIAAGIAPTADTEVETEEQQKKNYMASWGVGARNMVAKHNIKKVEIV